MAEGDIADIEENKDYYATVLDSPMTLNHLVHELYRLRNEQFPNNPVKIPTDDELHRDVDRPLHCDNTVRCNFHDNIGE